MGELILCSQQLAAMPYYIENVSLNVYSLDELCYYIKNNTCLLDADFMDDELCDWVENEQHLPDIAQNLRNIKAGGGVLSEFTGCLMSACGYCTKEEQKQIRNTLQEMEHKSAFECGKIKADRFLENRKYVSSIAEYRKLLQSCETEMPQMVGAVWHNLGTAYASRRTARRFPPASTGCGRCCRSPEFRLPTAPGCWTRYPSSAVDSTRCPASGSD